MEVVVTGAFDNPRSRELRFLQEASRFGKVTVLLWDDQSIRAATGRTAKFPLAERSYFLGAVRYVSQVVPVAAPAESGKIVFPSAVHASLWIDFEHGENGSRREFCRERRMEYRVLRDAELSGFPEPSMNSVSVPNRKKVVVTGCYDWLHSGHVRFFEEVSAYGDLYVVVGHDANIRLLKGEGHPLLSQEERRFMVGSIRYVTQALVSSGQGWLDADPEIQRLKPEIYAVNEDGDRGGKRDYCQQRGLEYLVLKRVPAPGLPARSSTDLRGF